MYIWPDLGIIRPTDSLLMAGLGTPAHSMPLRDNVYIKTYIKLDPNLENRLEVFYI